MKTLLCSIYDEAIEVYYPPFHSVTLRDAERQFGLAATKPDSALFGSPQDYSLYHVATFDDHTATYENINPPSLICRATKFRPSPELTTPNTEAKP
ncbi:MAG: nonstructural protein [Microvirus sp.]|nr:MAG: nonstructural protein [Microvirus sp.]